MILITMAKLEQAKPENLLRLAQSLNLDIMDMSYDQVIELVWETINIEPCQNRFDNPQRRQEYADMWEDL